MRSIHVSLISVALLVAWALGVAAQDEQAADDGGAEPSGQVISDMVMEAWASGDEIAIEGIYDPSVVMKLDRDQLAGDREDITSVIKGVISYGNTYHQVGPVIDYVDAGGDLYVGTIVEVRGPGHPAGVPVIGFYRVRDGKVIRHVFMDAEHYWGTS